MRTGISWLDFKLGLRMLLKYPALTLVGGLGLAVSIAISVGFFAFLSANVYPTLPLEEGERIVALENRDATTVVGEERRSLHDFVTWRDELRLVEDLGAFRSVSRTLITGVGHPEPVEVAEMTAAGFTVARTPPLLGRPLVEEDEMPGAPQVVVIGHDVWMDRFAGDSRIVGRDIRLGSVSHTVVGVMPEGFAFPIRHSYWAPLRIELAAFERREGPKIFIFGRLARGVTMAQAQAELDAIGERTAAEFPETHARLRPMVMPYTHSVTDIQGTTTWMVVQMQVMMSLLLIVVALNVGVLVYARTATRQGEIAVRTALGASRGRVVGQLFTEALVLSLGAAAVGLALAQLGVGLGNRIMEQEMGVPFWMDYGLQAGTVLFTVGLAVFTAVIVGVMPALQSTGRRLQGDLRQLGSGTGMRLGRTWTALIVAQVAIAVAALPAAVNMGWGEIRNATTRPAYPAAEFLVAGLGIEAAPIPNAAAEGDSPEAAGRFGARLTELMRQVEAEPQVAGVTFRADLPGRSGPIEVEGVQAPAGSPAGHEVRSSGGDPGMLDLYGARLLAGRGFEPGDMGEEASAVLVNRAFVRQVLGGGDALGRRVRYAGAGEVDEDAQHSPAGSVAVPDRWFQIVGVVEDLQVNPMSPELIRPQLFYPVAPDQVQQASLAIRLRGSDPASFAPTLRGLTVAVDPSLRLGQVRSLADSDRQDRLAVRLVALVIGLVLLSVFLLSAAGIYALTSFTVTRRRKEIGIRTALGARPREVLWSVFSRAARQVGLGLAVGIASAILIDSLTGGGLMGGRANVLLPVIGGIMGVVALLAALGPVRRGLRIEPTEALRADT